MPPRPQLTPIKPDRVRKLSFKRGISIGWIDNRIKSADFGFLQEMQRREKGCWALYTFLCSSVDSNGLCKYSIRKIAQALQKGYNAVISAKNVLEDMDLLATRVLPRERNLTLWQVLSLPIREGQYKMRVNKPSARADKEVLDRTAGLLVDQFYFMTGQEKISSTKRQRGIKTVKRLIDDGFKLEDIQAAINWTVKNMPDVYSFAIIEETIGQAGAEKVKVEREQAATQLASRFRDGDRVRWGRKRGTVEGAVVRFDDGVRMLRQIAEKLERI